MTLSVRGLLLSALGLLLCSNAPAQITYEDAAQRLVRTFKGHGDWIASAAFSPDGARIVSASADGTLKLWETATGRELRTLTLPRVPLRDFAGKDTAATLPIRVSSIAFLPDGARILFGSSDKTLQLWELDSGRVLRKFTGHTDEVRSIALSSDGTRALSGSHDKTMKLWDVPGGRELRTFKGHTETVYPVRISRDGSRALSGSGDKTVKLWDLTNGTVLRTFAHHDSLRSAALSPDGTRVLSSWWLDKLIVWNTSNGQELLKLDAGAHAVAFSPDGRFFASSGCEGNPRMIPRPCTKPFAKLWQSDTGRELREFLGHAAVRTEPLLQNGNVTSVVFSPDGRFILTGSTDKTLKLWNVSEWTMPR